MRSLITALGAALLFFAPLPCCRGDDLKDSLPPPPESKRWQMVWHDEFNGNSLDMTKWAFPPDGPRAGGFWMKKAIAIDGKGHLVFTAMKEGDKYIGGCVRTKGKFEHACGYYVARIECQKQTGHWAAFWLHNECVKQVGNDGRDGTEIDIMEKFWLDDRVQLALHWDGYEKHHKWEGKVVMVPDVMHGFHTFGVLWLPDGYTFYIDGKVAWRSSAGGICQVPLYIKLTDEVGLLGGDIHLARLPDHFLVDYVRVYDLVGR
jgi:beta-glucanase (GH16 family)